MKKVMNFDICTCTIPGKKSCHERWREEGWSPPWERDMNKVYVVAAGEYSAYHIEAVFSTKEKAVEYCSIRPSCGIGEWILDEVDAEESNISEFWKVEIRRDGEIMGVMEWDKEHCGPKHDRFWVDIRGGTYDPDDPSVLHTGIWAKDRETAIKIANERRTGYLAAHAWPGKEYPDGFR